MHTLAAILLRAAKAGAVTTLVLFGASALAAPQPEPLAVPEKLSEVDVKEQVTDLGQLIDISVNRHSVKTLEFEHGFYLTDRSIRGYLPRTGEHGNAFMEWTFTLELSDRNLVATCVLLRNTWATLSAAGAQPTTSDCLIYRRDVIVTNEPVVPTQ